MGRVGWMIISDDDPSSSAKPTMERISKYVRETAGWMWGWMSVAPELRQTSQLARHSSVDIDDAPGCCPAKILISSIVSFATRSRRKEGKEKQVSKRVASAAYAPRQPPKSSDLCVCDSIDDKTVKKFTTLPTGIDQREWIAHNTLGLFDHVSALSGCISELCTPVTCPHMSFPGTSKAPYVDDRGKRQNYPAMQYIDCAMTSCEQISRNEDIFPTKYGSKFSNDFEPTVKRMLRMLWHCIGHLYTKHWEHMGALELRPQVALVLAHLSELGKSFNLIDPKDQVHVDNTVIMIRPILAIASPLGVSEDQGERKSENSDRATRVPTSKSGSWGGYPSPSVLSCKPYSQTC